LQINPDKKQKKEMKKKKKAAKNPIEKTKKNAAFDMEELDKVE